MEPVGKAGFSVPRAGRAKSTRIGSFTLRRRGRLLRGRQLAGFFMGADACMTHKANFRNVTLFGCDVARFLRDDRKSVRSAARLSFKAGIDLVYGEPPARASARSVQGSNPLWRGMHRFRGRPADTMILENPRRY
jgi:hypothetical protein